MAKYTESENIYSYIFFSVEVELEEPRVSHLWLEIYPKSTTGILLFGAKYHSQMCLLIIKLSFLVLLTCIQAGTE